MKNILITGGSVHAHLDSVKIITNNFKGGLIAKLAGQLSMGKDVKVIYLCSQASRTPIENPNLRVIYHQGFQDYMKQVLELAPTMDAVILGAAVTNLIPYKPIEGKFPSHNYKPGDLVPLVFQIAPRVIDEVKKVAPKTHLFGFKLLDGVLQEELFRAAYGVLLESRATAIIANDRQNLEQKYVITKERAIHPMDNLNLANWIWDVVQDEYYKTSAFPRVEHMNLDNPYPEELKKVKDFNNQFPHRWGGFLETPEGYVFGTLAQRCGTNSFWTTGRGKHEAESYAFVSLVDHTEKKIYLKGQPKATLNAPLLSHIFNILPQVDFIAHSHIIPRKFRELGLPVLGYAPPGTVRDSIRPVKGSFIIPNHGLFLLYDKEGNLIWTIK